MKGSKIIISCLSGILFFHFFPWIVYGGISYTNIEIDWYLLLPILSYGFTSLFVFFLYALWVKIENIYLCKICLFFGLILFTFLIHWNKFDENTGLLMQQMSSLNDFYTCYSYFSILTFQQGVACLISLAIVSTLYFILNRLARKNKDKKDSDKERIHIKNERNRIGAFFIDLIFIKVLIIGCLIVNMFFKSVVSPYVIVWVLFVVYLLFKDSFKGMSVGRKLFRVQVRKESNGLPATAFQCFVRNLFLVIWFIEVFVWYFNPTSQRIGDYVAKTIVKGK